MKKKLSITISVLLMQEDRYWVAQGLEHDITAQGRSIKEAKKAFQRTMIGQICLDLKDNLKPLNGIKKAPRLYWSLFEKAEQLKKNRKFAIPKSVPQKRYTVDAIANDYRIAA